MRVNMLNYRPRHEERELSIIYIISKSITKDNNEQGDTHR